MIEKVFVFDSASQTFTEAGYKVGGFFYGDNLTLTAEQGLSALIVYAKQDAIINFTTQYCHTWTLKPGANLVGS